MPEYKTTHPLGDIERLSTKFSYENIDIDVCELHGFINVFAKKGQEKQVAKKLDIGMKAGLASQAGNLTAFPLKYGNWAIVSNEPTTTGFGRDIQTKIDGIGYISEQSSSRVQIRVTGKKAFDLMSRGCRLDLHPTVISKDFCAQTIMAQIGVMMHLVDEKPTFDLYVYSGFAKSFWHWIDETAEQFSLESQY